MPRLLRVRDQRQVLKHRPAQGGGHAGVIPEAVVLRDIRHARLEAWPEVTVIRPKRLQTALVRAAQRRGCVAANGVSMLLYQGAESLRLWVSAKGGSASGGKQAIPIRAMRTALVAAVKRH